MYVYSSWLISNVPYYFQTHILQNDDNYVLYHVHFQNSAKLQNRESNRRMDCNILGILCRTVTTVPKACHSFKKTIQKCTFCFLFNLNLMASSEN